MYIHIYWLTIGSRLGACLGAKQSQHIHSPGVGLAIRSSPRESKAKSAEKKMKKFTGAYLGSAVPRGSTSCPGSRPCPLSLSLVSITAGQQQTRPGAAVTYGAAERRLLPGQNGAGGPWRS